MTTFRLKTTNPQNFFCLNINFCKRLQTLITSISFKIWQEYISPSKIFIFDLSFFCTLILEQRFYAFTSRAQLCLASRLLSNQIQTRMRLIVSFSKLPFSYTRVFLVSPILYQYPRTQLHIFSFLILHACFTSSRSLWRILIKNAWTQ